MTDREIHGIINSFSEKALISVLRRLTQTLSGNSEQKALIWSEKVHPWIEAYWPRAGTRNTTDTSGAMLAMLAECGDAFPEASSWSLTHLRLDVGRILYRLNKNGHAGQHPEPMLRVLDVVVGVDGIPIHQRSTLRDMLDELKTAKSSLTADVRFKRLYQIATQ